MGGADVSAVEVVRVEARGLRAVGFSDREGGGGALVLWAGVALIPREPAGSEHGVTRVCAVSDATGFRRVARAVQPAG